MAKDFIREAGAWKIRNQHVYLNIFTSFDVSWTVPLAGDVGDIFPPGLPEEWKPNRPSTYSWMYSPSEVMELVPAPPEPHDTYDPSMDYLRWSGCSTCGMIGGRGEGMAESFLAQSAFGDAGLCPLTVNDLEQATNVLSEAFSEYPLTNYLFDKKSAKEAGSRNFHRVSLRLGMRRGEVYGSSSKLEGVAIWFPPGKQSLSFPQLVRCGFLSHLTNRGNTLRENMKALQRIMTLVNHAGEVHARHASVPHWYLMEIGVRDRCRGMGYASRLLKPVLSLCDLKRHPCYLETHDERNLETYNHFGFSVVDESRLPGSELRHWAMMRTPQESPQ